MTTSRQPRTYPHCDQRILHAPGECRYCDQSPDLQQIRQDWGIAFTGHHPGLPDDAVVLPCPADVSRPAGTPADHRQWPGNRAYGHEPFPIEHDAPADVIRNDPSIADHSR